MVAQENDPQSLVLFEFNEKCLTFCTKIPTNDWL
jgi:hypothetical protein